MSHTQHSRCKLLCLVDVIFFHVMVTAENNFITLDHAAMRWGQMKLRIWWPRGGTEQICSCRQRLTLHYPCLLQKTSTYGAPPKATFEKLKALTSNSKVAVRDSFRMRCKNETIEAAKWRNQQLAKLWWCGYLMEEEEVEEYAPVLVLFPLCIPSLSTPFDLESVNKRCK